jgi:hypothetical protein
VDYHGSIKNADEAMYKQKLARKQRIGSWKKVLVPKMGE